MSYAFGDLITRKNEVFDCDSRSPENSWDQSIGMKLKYISNS